MAALAAAQVSKREAAKTENRKNFPFAAELADLLAEFNPKLVYAEENGSTIGKRPDTSLSLDGDRLVAMIDATTRTVTAMNKRSRK